MKQIHIECLPDELLIKKLGFSQKVISHHFGKSKVFKKLESVQNHFAMVDEDPGSPQTSYEKSLRLIEEAEGIKQYADNSGNKIFVLKGKLEDWTISICKQHKIKLKAFGLPEKPNELHDVINQRLQNFEKLIEYLLQKKNPAIIKLKNWLN